MSRGKYPPKYLLVFSTRVDRLFDGGMVSKQPTIVFAVYPNDRSNLHAKIPEELASKIANWSK